MRLRLLRLRSRRLQRLEAELQGCRLPHWQRLQRRAVQQHRRPSLQEPLRLYLREYQLPPGEPLLRRNRSSQALQAQQPVEATARRSHPSLHLLQARLLQQAWHRRQLLQVRLQV